MKRCPIALLVALLLSACVQEDGTLLHHYAAPHGKVWQTTDTLTYSIPLVQETADYTFSLGLRLSIDFPYSGVSLVAETHLKEPDALWCDTIHYVTMATDGLPAGTGITLQQSEQPFATHHLLQGQTGEVRIFHIVDVESLPNIVDVGLKVQRQ